MLTLFHILVTLVSLLNVFPSNGFMSTIQLGASQHSSVISFQLSPNIEDNQILLDSGISAQVISCKPVNVSQAPLVFIHGSFHAAWCWAENYFEYFSSLGYPVIALSLRGTGGSFAGDGVKKVKIEEHVEDIQSLLNKIPGIIGTDQMKPVLVSHSFGGVAVMKYLELYPQEASNLSGMVTMCSVPPSGNGPMTLRFLRRSLRKSWDITIGFVLKKCIDDDNICRKLFFGGPRITLPDGKVDDYGVTDNDINRYQQYFKRDSSAILDVVALAKVLPSKFAIEGRARSLSQYPPCLVIGATRDFIVDQQGVEETSKYYGQEKALFIDSPHDIMLGENWRNGAEVIHQFVQKNCYIED